MCSTKSQIHIIEIVSLKMNFDQMSSSMDPVLGEATGPFNIKDHKCLNDTTICAFRVINVSKIHFISGSRSTARTPIYPVFTFFKRNGIYRAFIEQDQIYYRNIEPDQTYILTRNYNNFLYFRGQF